MADEDNDLAAEEAASGGGKKKLIIIGAIALVLLLGIGGGAYWYFFMNEDAATDETEVLLDEDGNPIPIEEEANSEDSGKALYHKLTPKFVTTFEANSRQRYVQMEVTLVTRDEEVMPALVTHAPLIRNAIVMLVAEQDYLDLQTVEGKASLRAAAKQSVQDILKKEIGKPGIDQVLFTDFVMQ